MGDGHRGRIIQELGHGDQPRVRRKRGERNWAMFSSDLGKWLEGVAFAAVIRTVGRRAMG